MIGPGLDLESGAVFDASGRYRYLLWRRWRREQRLLTFVMLNPSAADETVDDPTIRRCAGFARDAGFAGIRVVNLFAFRTSEPRSLRGLSEPADARNVSFLESALSEPGPVCAAWGNNGWPHAARLTERLRHRPDTHCLGRTKQGQPKHPLYLARTVTLQPF